MWPPERAIRQGCPERGRTAAARCRFVDPLVTSRQRPTGRRGPERRIETPSSIPRPRDDGSSPSVRPHAPAVGPLQEIVLLNATVAVRRLQSRLRGDGNGPQPRVESPHPPGLAFARRADAALRAASRRPAAAASADPAARPARTPAALLRRLESPERLVPILVAAFLLVASVTAVPGLATGATGATEGAGVAPRLVVGGAPGAGGNVGVDADLDVGVDAGLLGPNDGAGTRPRDRLRRDGRQHRSSARSRPTAPWTWPASSSPTGRSSSPSWSTRRSRMGATSSAATRSGRATR